MTTPALNSVDAAEATTPAWFRAYTRFLFAPIDPTGLGFLRLCCGLLVFYTHLTYSYDLFSYLGPNGWLDRPAGTFLRKEIAFPQPATNWTDPSTLYPEKGAYLWSIYFHVQDPFWVVVVHVSILAVMLLFAIGLWTRVTSVLTWMAAMSYVQALPTSMLGQDTMMMILLLYLKIGDSGAALSVDRWLEWRRARRQTGNAAGATLKPSWSANLAIRMIQIHMCIIYLVSGLSKLLGPSWWNGTALWLCLANYNFAPMRVGLYNQMLVFLCSHRPLWEICMTSGDVFTLFTEICFLFLVWNKRWRPFMVSCSVLMHLGIGLIMNLVVFSLFMMVMVSAFLPPEAVRSVLDQMGDQVRAWFAKKTPAAEAANKPKESLVLTRT